MQDLQTIVPQRQLNILVAEDETQISTLVSRRLRDSGHTVVVAGDGQEALEKFETAGGKFDLVITDSSMPRMSGIELVERVRKDGFAGKIIMASAFMTVDPQVLEESHLVDRTVQKPYTISALQKVVEEICFVPEPAIKVASAPVVAAPKFHVITKIALTQFVFWAIADMVSTWIGLRSGLMEGNPFSAWTMNVLSPYAGLILKELFITAPICVGGGYICYRMARGMSPRRQFILANLPVWVGVALHGIATLNNVWQLNS
ncbi:MAG TPA: response regulator [Chthoniobacteraceae bacterium]|nr:response regulator [Chthoniobacteraceae bacterium]